MPDGQGRLFASDIAKRVGITESDWRARVSRGHAPKPSDLVLHAGANRPVWNPGTIEEYLKARVERKGKTIEQAIADHPSDIVTIAPSVMSDPTAPRSVYAPKRREG